MLAPSILALVRLADVTGIEPVAPLACKELEPSLVALSTILVSNAFNNLGNLLFARSQTQCTETFDSHTVRAQSPPAWQVSPEGRRFLDGAEIFGVPMQR